MSADISLVYLEDREHKPAGGGKPVRLHSAQALGRLRATLETATQYPGRTTRPLGLAEESDSFRRTVELSVIRNPVFGPDAGVDDREHDQALSPARAGEQALGLCGLLGGRTVEPKKGRRSSELQGHWYCPCCGSNTVKHGRKQSWTNWTTLIASGGHFLPR